MSVSSIPAIGKFITPETPFSPSIINSRMVFQGTGQEIVTLSPTYPGLLAFCTEDYLTIFRKNRLYARNAENTNWMEQTAVRHLHNTDSDSSGGQLVDI